jgi:hypothetical protein
MGVVQHSALLITTFSYEHYVALTDWINENVPEEYMPLFSFTPGIVNSERTVVFNPSGSKLGWAPSNIHKNLSERLIDWLDSQAYEADPEDTVEAEEPHDHPYDSCYTWVEVTYGEHGAYITASNCPDCR